MVVTHHGVLRLVATRAGAPDRHADPEPRRLLVRRRGRTSCATPSPSTPLPAATDLPTAE